MALDGARREGDCWGALACCLACLARLASLTSLALRAWILIAPAAGYISSPTLPPQNREGGEQRRAN